MASSLWGADSIQLQRVTTMYTCFPSGLSVLQFSNYKYMSSHFARLSLVTWKHIVKNSYLRISSHSWGCTSEQYWMQSVTKHVYILCTDVIKSPSVFNTLSLLLLPINFLDGCYIMVWVGSTHVIDWTLCVWLLVLKLMTNIRHRNTLTVPQACGDRYVTIML
jgi:hypothetical protein